MSNDFEKNGEFRLKGWHVLLGFIGFFGVIIGVNLTMATLASKSWTGLIVENSYVASQEYNDKLEAARTQHKLGWTSKIHYSDNHLSIHLKDKEDKPLLMKNLHVKIGRPAFEALDQTLDMLEIGAGTFMGEVALTDGEWALEIFGEHKDKTYRRDARLLISNGKVSFIE